MRDGAGVAAAGAGGGVGVGVGAGAVRARAWVWAWAGGGVLTVGGLSVCGASMAGVPGAAGVEPRSEGADGVTGT